MRYGEDDYGYNGENSFFEDFSVYPTAPAASQFVAPQQQAAPQFAAMPQQAAPQQAAPAFSDDDYTGRMGPDGEPERYSTMRGGDPRVRQQQELAERERRLQESFSIDNWLKSGNKDVRGTTAASQITLNPGTQYRIRDYSGRNDGQVIASGSTPEEFLMMQDIARGLARQGTNADYRLEQVGGEAAENFGQYRDPATGEVVSVIGGDLYNKPIAGDIIKIALPLALNVIPGLGLGAALGGKLGLSGLAAKAAGVGLTSALGRTGAGVLTGENVGDALKAGAVSGLASGATAGLLGVSKLDNVINSALSGAKGTLAGEAAGQAAAQGAGQAAASLPGEIVVSAARNALPSVLSGGLSAAGGSLLGDVGQSLVQADPYQQALEQARMQNQFAPTAPPMASEDILEVVGQRGTGAVPGAGALAGAAPPLLDSTLSDIIRQYEAPQQMAETPAEDEILVSNTATPKVDLSGIASLAGAGSPLLETTLNDIVRQYEAPQQMAETPAEDEILVSSTATPKVDLSGLSALGGAAAMPGADVNLELPGEELIDVAGSRIPKTSVSDGFSAAAGALDLGAPANLELPGEELIDVAGNRIPKTTLDSAISAGAGAGAGALNLGTSTNLELPGEELIDVAGRRIPKTTLDSVISAGAGALAPTTPPVDLQPGEELIDVAGNRIPKTELDSTLSAAAAALVPNMPTDLELPGEDLVKDAADDKKDDKKGSTISKVLTGIAVADALAKLVGGSDKGGTKIGTAGNLDPVFTSKLPTSSSFLSASDLSPRDMSGVNWKRYGFGPEKSFFNYVPSDEDNRRAMIAPPQPDTQLARGGALAVKKGGAPAKESFAVKGQGTGRSDEIPALLSDGEYVIDAETVAMLGDGSSEAGAKRLDDFRVNIRKHKGRNLAKGKFSANAKAPERYLSGGRVK